MQISHILVSHCHHQAGVILLLFLITLSILQNAKISLELLLNLDSSFVSVVAVRYFEY